MLKLKKDSFIEMFKSNHITARDAVLEGARFVVYSRQDSEHLLFWGWGKTLEEATTDALNYLDFNSGSNIDKITSDQCLFLEIIPDDAEEIKSYEQEMVVKVTSDKPIPPGLKISINISF